MIKNLVCINCPRGCQLEVDDKTFEVKGNSCPRGKEYGINEIRSPKRVVTSTVKVKNGELTRCSVKTESPIPKEKIFHIMQAINKVELTAPVTIGSVVIKNVLGSGVNVIATKDVAKK